MEDRAGEFDEMKKSQEAVDMLPGFLGYFFFFET
jgi:hypothetical protein